MSIAEKLSTVAENIPKVYEAGKKSMIDESKIIEKTASAINFLNINDVSEVSHEVEIQLTSDTITDFSDTEVIVRGKNLWDKEYASNKNNWKVLNASYSSIPIYVGKGNKVTLSYQNKLENGLSFYFAVMTEDSTADAVTTWLYHSTASSLTNNPATITSTQDYIYVRATMNMTGIEKIMEYIGNNLQVEINKVASEYQPYIKEVYTPTSDGKINIKSISPVMNIYTNKTDINISANYHKSYGMQTAYDDFWDRYQQNGKRISYSCAFCGDGWNTETFKPKYSIGNVASSMYMMFRDFNRASGSTPIDMVELCEKQGITINTSKASNMTYIFWNANISRLGTISIGHLNSFENTFLKCTNLITIEEIDFGTTGKQVWYSMFGECKKLENINSVKGIIGQNADLSVCPLTTQSIKNIVNVLSGTASGKTISLSKSAVNTAFNIDVDDESTWGEGTEFYELRHSKDNWTFSYV